MFKIENKLSPEDIAVSLDYMGGYTTCTMKIEKDEFKRSVALPFNIINGTDKKGNKTFSINPIKLTKDYEKVYSIRTYSKDSFYLEKDSKLAESLSEYFHANKDVETMLVLINSLTQKTEEYKFIENIDFTDVEFALRSALPIVKKTEQTALEESIKKQKPLTQDAMSLISQTLKENSKMSILDDFIRASAPHLLNMYIDEFPNASPLDELDILEAGYARNVQNNIDSLSTALFEKYLSSGTSTQAKFEFGDNSIDKFKTLIEKDEKSSNKVSFIVDALEDAIKKDLNLNEFIEAFTKNEQLLGLAKTNGKIETFIKELEAVNKGFLLGMPTLGNEEFKNAKKFASTNLSKKDNFYAFSFDKEPKDSENFKDLKITSFQEYLNFMTSESIEKKGLFSIYNFLDSEKSVFEFHMNKTALSNRVAILNEDQMKSVVSGTPYGTSSFKIDSRYLGIDSSNDTYLLMYEANTTKRHITSAKGSSLEYYKIPSFPEWNDKLSKEENKEKAFKFLQDFYAESKNRNHAYIRNVATVAKKTTHDLLKAEVNGSKEVMETFNSFKQVYKQLMKDNIFYGLSSLSMSREDKSIPVDFFYGEKPSLVSLSMLEKDPLLSNYIAGKPEGAIIYELAKSNGIALPKPFKTFSVTNLEENKKGVNKTLVVSENLGALKLAFLPKTFSLKEDAEKKKVKEILQKIVKSELGEDAKELDIKEKMASLEKYIDDSSYIFVKNERVADHVSGFSSKEIMVAADEYGKDMGKINIPLAPFYKEIEEQGIYNIKDYIHIEKINSSTLNKINVGLVDYMADIKDSHAKNLDRSVAEIDKVIMTNIYPLIQKPKDELTDNEKMIYKKVAKLLKMNEYYRQYLKPRTIADLIGTLEKMKVEAPNARHDVQKEDDFTFSSEEEKAKAINLVKQIKGNILSIFENQSEKLLSSMMKIFNGDQVKVNHLLDELSCIHSDVVELESMSKKTLDILAMSNIIEDTVNKAKKIEQNLRAEKSGTKEHGQLKLDYNNIIIKMLKTTQFFYKKTLGLTDYQFNEAFNFLVLKDKSLKSVEAIFAEPRTGKTRAAALSLFLQSLLANKKDGGGAFYAQKKNIEDIVSQFLDSFPIMAKDMLVYGSDKSTYMLKPERCIEYPLSFMDNYYPNLVRVLRDHIVSSSERENVLEAQSQVLINTFSADMERLYNSSRGVTVQELKKEYKDSPFIKIFDLGNKNITDRKYNAMIKNTFLYVQMLADNGILRKDKGVEGVLKSISNSIKKIQLSMKKYSKIEGEINNKFSMAILPKTLTSGYDVASGLGSIKTEKKRHDTALPGKNGILSTSYMVDFEKSKKDIKFSKSEYTHLKYKEKIEEQIMKTYEPPLVVQELAQKGIAAFTIKSVAEDKITELVEHLKSNYLFFDKYAEKLNEQRVSNGVEEVIYNEDMLGLLDKRIDEMLKKATENLIPSKYYGHPDFPINDSCEINLSEVFERNSLLQEFEAIGFSEEDKGFNETIDLISNKDVLSAMAKRISSDNYMGNLTIYINSAESQNLPQKLKKISPIFEKDLRGRTSGFEFTVKPIGAEVVMPYVKDKEGLYKSSSIVLSYDEIDVKNLKTPKKVPLVGVDVILKNEDSKNYLIIPEQKALKNALNNGARIKRLDNTTCFCPNEEINSLVAIDEVHASLGDMQLNPTKGATQHNIYSSMVRNAETAIIITGTSNSGDAASSTRTMSLGVDSKLTSSISSNIAKYCTNYSFKNETIKATFIILQSSRNSNIEKYFYEKAKEFPSYKALNELENFAEKEIYNYYDSLYKNEDKDELEEIKASLRNGGFSRAINEISNEVLPLLEKNKKKINVTLLEAMQRKISVLATVAPGISNMPTYVTFIGGFNEESTKSLTRTSKDIKHNIVDEDIIKQILRNKEASRVVKIDTSSFRDKVLASGDLLQKFTRAFALASLRKNTSEMFNLFINEMLNEKNVDKFISKIEMTTPPEYSNKKDYIFYLTSPSNSSTKDSLGDIYLKNLESNSLSQVDVSTDKKILFKETIKEFSEFLKNFKDINEDAKKEVENSAMSPKGKAKSKKNAVPSIKYNEYELNKTTSWASFPTRIASSSRSYHYNGKDGANHFYFDNKLRPIVQLDKKDIELSFIVNLKVSRWDFLNKKLDVRFNLCSPDDKKLLEYLADEKSPSLYKREIDKGDNIRIFSSRTALANYSILDSIEAGLNRNNKDKSFVVLVNQSSSDAKKTEELLDSISPTLLKDNNIEVKICTNTAFYASMLKDVGKNPNNQIVAVANYKAIAEGTDFSMTKACFYVGEVEEAAKFIQSAYRGMNHKNKEGDLYFSQNGQLQKYKLKNYINTTEKLEKTSNAIKGYLTLDKTEKGSLLPEEINGKEANTFRTCVNSKAISRLGTYNTVMGGIPPHQDIDKNKPFVEKNPNYKSMEELRTEREEVKKLADEAKKQKLIDAKAKKAEEKSKKAPISSTAPAT